MFGAMVSATEGEKDRGTVSEHVVNGDANYLEDFVTVLGSTPTKPAADLDPKTAARIAKGTELSDGFISVFKNDWGIPSPQFQFDQLKLDLGAAGDDLINFFVDKGENGLKAWEKVFHVDIPQLVRTNTTYLSAISKQVDNYGDDIVFQLERVLPHIDPADYDNFFTALDNPKSLDHVRSIVGDFESIPGINLSAFDPNAPRLPEVEIPAPNTWLNPWLVLPADEAINFTNATAKSLAPGQKIYRVLGENQSSQGGYWTYDLPASKADLFGGTAVRPEWNAATHYVEYIVPSGGLKVWDGPAASQRIIDEIDEVNLPGGATQIYVPEPNRQVGSGFENLPKIPISL